MENKKVIVRTKTMPHVANRTITIPIGTVTFNENCEIVVNQDEAQILLESGLGFEIVSGDVSLFKEPKTPSVREEKKNKYDDVFVTDLLHSFENLKEQNRLLLEENDSLKKENESLNKQINQIVDFNTTLTEKETKIAAVKDKVENVEDQNTELIEKQKKAILSIKSMKEAKEFLVDFDEKEWSHIKDLDKIKQYLISKI